MSNFVLVVLAAPAFIIAAWVIMAELGEIIFPHHLRRKRDHLLDISHKSKLEQSSPESCLLLYYTFGFGHLPVSFLSTVPAEKLETVYVFLLNVKRGMSEGKGGNEGWAEKAEL